MDWSQSLALPHASCVALGKSLSFPEPQFSYNRHNCKIGITEAYMDEHNYMEQCQPLVNALWIN